jgi:hypothetical protein
MKSFTGSKKGPCIEDIFLFMHGSFGFKTRFFTNFRKGRDLKTHMTIVFLS